MHGAEMLVAILIPLSFFLLVFGIIYMQKKENLALIEKGINPRQSYSRPAPFKNLKWALLLIGAGMGLFVAYILDTYVLQNTEAYNQGGQIMYYHREGGPAIYFSLIAIGGGLGLFGSYKMEKKWWDENKETAQP